MENDLTMNSTVSWNTDSSSFGWYDTCGTYCPCPWDYYRPWYERVRVEYYPSVVYSQSKVEQAFKIVSKLMEMKIVKTLSVKKFVELVNEIAKII